RFPDFAQDGELRYLVLGKKSVDGFDGLVGSVAGGDPPVQLISYHRDIGVGWHDHGDRIAGSGAADDARDPSIDLLRFTRLLTHGPKVAEVVFEGIIGDRPGREGNGGGTEHRGHDQDGPGDSKDEARYP